MSPRGGWRCPTGRQGSRAARRALRARPSTRDERIRSAAAASAWQSSRRPWRIERHHRLEGVPGDSTRWVINAAELSMPTPSSRTSATDVRRPAGGGAGGDRDRPGGHPGIEQHEIVPFRGGMLPILGWRARATSSASAPRAPRLRDRHRPRRRQGRRRPDLGQREIVVRSIADALIKVPRWAGRPISATGAWCSSRTCGVVSRRAAARFAVPKESGDGETFILFMVAGRRMLCAAGRRAHRDGRAGCRGAQRRAVRRWRGVSLTRSCRR